MIQRASSDARNSAAFATSRGSPRWRSRCWSRSRSHGAPSARIRSNIARLMLVMTKDGTERVDADAVPAEVDGHLFREDRDRALRGRVREAGPEGPTPVIDERFTIAPPSGRSSVGRTGAAHEEHALDVDPHASRPSRLRSMSRTVSREGRIPALLTRMSRRPNRSSVTSTTRRASATAATLASTERLAAVRPDRVDHRVVEARAGRPRRRRARPPARSAGRWPRRGPSQRR